GGGGKASRGAGQPHGLALPGRARLRLSRRGRVARHRRHGTTPRRRQHAARTGGPGGAGRIFTELAHFFVKAGRSLAGCCSTSSSRGAAWSAAPAARCSATAVKVVWSGSAARAATGAALPR